MCRQAHLNGKIPNPNQIFKYNHKCSFPLYFTIIFKCFIVKNNLMEGKIDVTSEINQNETIQLKQWLNNNRLGKLAKLIENDDDITIDDLLEMNKDDLQKWVVQDLKLNTMFCSKLWNALNKKRQKLGQQISAPAKVVKIIITEKEEKYSNILAERIKDIDTKQNKFKNALKTLNNSEKTQITKISNTMSNIIEILKKRQNELETIIKTKCIEKEKFIQNKCNLLQNYRKTLNEAQIKYGNMLQENVASDKRNNYISSIIEKHVNSNTLCNMQLETKPEVLFTINNSFIQQIKSLGEITGYDIPFPPKISVSKVEANSMTVQFEKSANQPKVVKNDKYELRVQLTDALEVDEKMDENVVVKTVDASNSVVTVDGLKVNTIYYLLSRAHNQYGWSQFCKGNILKQKTKNRVIVNYDGVFDRNSLLKGYEDRIMVDAYTVNMAPCYSMAAMTKPLVRGNLNVICTRWQVVFVDYDTNHQYNFIGVIADPKIKHYNPAQTGYRSYGITTAKNKVYVDGKYTTDTKYNSVIKKNVAVLVEFHWNSYALIFKSEKNILWQVTLPQNIQWWPAIAQCTKMAKIIPFS
eukprot:490895_1